MKLIIGAGLAGLIAAHAWPRARLIESAPQPAAGHKALLRFRSEAVAQLTGIEFRRVQVRKGIWSEGGFVEPNIRAANLYAQKCLGRLAGDRSIWNTAPAERFVAPDDFYDRLIEQVGDRVTWGHNFSNWRQTPTTAEPIVSTAPLDVALAGCGITTDLKFERAPIHVARFTVPGADVFQTVYFPDPDTPIYRASMTGSLLIVEAMAPMLPDERDCVGRAFGIDDEALVCAGTHKQHYGKIAPVDDAARKQLLFRLTHEHGIYSLGRFATWRNLILDDIVDDIAHIKKLVRGNAYDLRQHAR